MSLSEILVIGCLVLTHDSICSNLLMSPLYLLADAAMKMARSRRSSIIARQVAKSIMATQTSVRVFVRNWSALKV
jgi:hypothetical protein